jgi:tape measure domain-containing protein
MADNQISFAILAQDFYSQTMKAAQVAMSDLAKSGAAATDRLQKSFQTLNIKSQLDIEGEKKRIVAAFEQIKNSGVVTGNEIRRAQESMKTQLADLDSKLRGVAGSSQNAAEGSRKVAGGFGSIRDALGPLVAMLGAYSLVDIARMSVENAIKLQALNVQFKTVTGSSEAAGESLRFLREESNRLGLVFTDAADGFAKFSASAKGTALQGDGARRVFIGVSEAVTAMHLPAETSQRIFFQLQQMMSKNKVTAEDLNVVAESLPGTYTAVAQSMGLTVAEMRKQMESGNLLANDVLPKLAEQLHLTYGEAAEEGAKSAQAAMNRFKNEIVETTAKIGEVLLPVLTAVMNVASGVGSTIKWVIDILGPGAPVAVAFAAAIGLIALAQKFLTAEIIASTAAMLVNPLFLFILAGSAALFAVASGINAIAKAMGLVDEEAGKDATAARLQKEEALAAKKKKILDDYEAAMGISLDRQLQKEDDAYEKSLSAINAKYDAEIIAAKRDAVKIADIEKRQGVDITRIQEDHLQKRQEIRDNDLEKQRKLYLDSLTLAVAHAKALGDVLAQNVAEDKLDLERKITAIRKDYAVRIDLAKDNGNMASALESSMNEEINAIREQHSKDYLLRGFANQKEHLDQAQNAANVEIEIIKAQAANKVISEEETQARILVIQKDYAAKNLEIATAQFAIIADKYGPDSDKYKQALKEKESATKTFYATDIALANDAQAQEVKARETELAANRNILDQELNYLDANLATQLQSQKDMLRDRTISHAEYEANVAALEAEYRFKRLQAEEEESARILAIRRKELAALNPNTQTAEFQKGKAAELNAERDYNSKHAALVDARKDRDAKAEDAITEKHRGECAKRKTADEEAAAAQTKLYTKTYLLWDNAVNGAAAKVTALSAAAYNAWAGMTAQPLKVAESLESVRVAAVAAGDELLKMWKDANTPTIINVGWVDFYKRLNDFGVKAAQIKAEFLGQKVAAMELTDELSNVSGANWGIVRAATEAIKNMKLLDDATMNKIKAEIERVKQELESFRQTVLSTAAAIRDELDQLTMSPMELENKRYLKQMEDLRKQLEEAAKMQDDESQRQLQQAIEDATKLHELKMAQIAEQNAAQNASAAGSTPSGNPGAGFARGGPVGGRGLGDIVKAWLDPREWVIQPGATKFWGDGILQAFNEPWSQAGQIIAASIRGIPTLPYIPIPKINYATGGRATGGGDTYQNNSTINLQISVREIDEATVRREIIPVIERYTRRKK